MASVRSLDGICAVRVTSSTSDDPVRRLLADEAGADDFAAEINDGREYPEAWVSFEPIAMNLHDRDLRSAPRRRPKRR